MSKPNILILKGDEDLMGGNKVDCGTRYVLPGIQAQPEVGRQPASSVFPHPLDTPPDPSLEVRCPLGSRFGDLTNIWCSIFGNCA